MAKPPGESRSGPQGTRSGEGQDEPVAPTLQGVEENHRGHCQQSEDGKATHSALGLEERARTARSSSSRAAIRSTKPRTTDSAGASSSKSWRKRHAVCARITLCALN